MRYLSLKNVLTNELGLRASPVSDCKVLRRMNVHMRMKEVALAVVREGDIFPLN